MSGNKEIDEKIILNIDKEYLSLLKDEIARKTVREVLKLCDITLREITDIKAKSEIIKLKELIKDTIYDNLKDLIFALDSHSKGINLIEFIKWRIGQNDIDLTEYKFIKK